MPIHPALAAYFGMRGFPAPYQGPVAEPVDPGNPMQQPTDPAMPPVAPVPVSSVSPQILEYFKQVRPELFSQDAYDTARGEDEAQNRVNTAARGLQSATSLFTNRSPDYAGLEPTNAAVKALLAKQEMAQRSMAVGGQMSQLQAAQDEQDPTSARSMRAYATALQEPSIAAKVTAMGRLGTVSANDIQRIFSAAEAGGKIAHVASQTRNEGAAADAKEADLKPADPATIEALRKSGVNIPEGTPAGRVKDLADSFIRARGDFAEVKDAWGNTVGVMNRHTGKVTAIAPVMSGGGSATLDTGPDGKPIQWGNLTRDQQLQFAAKIAGNMMDPASLISRAEAFARNPVHPPAGNNKARALQNNLVEKLANVIDPNLDMTKQGATYKADVKSLEDMQTLVDRFEAFEATTLANLTMAETKAAFVADWGAPLANKSARWLAQNAAGDPNVAAFAAAREVAVTEVSKAIASAANNQSITDSQREHIEKMLPADATLEQIRAASDVLRQDMANKRKEYRGKLEAIKGRTSQKPQQAAGAPSQAAGNSGYMPKSARPVGR